MPTKSPKHNDFRIEETISLATSSPRNRNSKKSSIRRYTLYQLMFVSIVVFVLVQVLALVLVNNYSISLYTKDEPESLNDHANNVLPRRLNLSEADYAFLRRESIIKGYHSGSDNTFFGFVMGEISQRILSRKVAQSNVLIVSENAPLIKNKMASRIIQGLSDDEIEDLKTQIGHSVGGCFLLNAINQGHEVHTISVEGLEESSNKEKKCKIIDEWWSGVSDTRPDWILLAVFDPGIGNEDILCSPISTFLRESTVTYVIFGVHIKFDGSSGGFDTLKTLLRLKYKVQILSMSDWTEQDNWDPNTLITLENVDSFCQRMLELFLSSKSGKVFRAYFFATQGLDLAIPSRLEYLQTNAYDLNPYNNAINDFPIKQCPKNKFVKTIDFRKDLNLNPSRQGTINDLVLYNNSGKLISVDHQSVWFSSDTADQSEAACIKIRGTMQCNDEIDVHNKKCTFNDAACTTRIFPQNLPKADSSTSSIQPSNLLVIMIDPISMAHFNRTLPKTRELIHSLNFTTYHKYTVVGDNSGKIY